jgi:hypothetical protein
MIFYEKYKPLLFLNDSEYDVIALTGGRGSLKTGHVCRGVGKAMVEEKIRVCFFRETKETLQESIITEFKDILDEEFSNKGFVFNKEEVKHVNGSYAFFKGLKDVNKKSLENLKGIASKTKIFIVDEAQAVSKNVWDVLLPTLRSAKAVLIVIYNRVSDTLPVEEVLFLDYSRMCAPKGTYFVEVNYPEIEFLNILSPKWLQRAELMKLNRPADYETLYLNKVSDKCDNPVVKSWSQKNIGVGETSKNIYWSLDFNVNPQCSVICHWSGGRKFYFSDEIVLENVSTHKVAEEFIKIYRQKYDGKNVIINGDASGRNRSSNSEFTNYAIIMDALSREAIPFEVNVPKANTSISNRVANFDWHVASLEGDINIFINPECKHLIHACRLLEYDKNGNITEIPYAPGLKTIDYAKSHIYDAASYCVMINDPILESFTKTEKPTSLTLKEKFAATRY